MSYKKIQKRRKRKKIVSLIAILLIAYLFLKPTLNIISGGFKTSLPSKELLVESLNGEGFFIRDEKIIRSDAKGILKKIADEGERLGAGIEVANIESVKDNSHLEREILEIEQAIETLERSEVKLGILEDEKTDIEELQEEKIEEIQKKIINKDYNTIDISKQELSLYEKKQGDVKFSNKLASESIEKLKSKRDKIKQQINADNLKYYTPNGGIISYKVDGFEDIYTPHNLENYTYEKLDSDEYLEGMDEKHKEEENEISIGQAVYKIVDDFEWYMAIKVDNVKDTVDLDANQIIKLQIGDDPFKIKGKIVNINKGNNKALVIVKFNTMMYKFYDKRITKVKLIKSETNTFKIPKRSILKKDNQEGVYIKNKGGIVEFKPVFEIKEIGEYVYVKTGDTSSNVTLKNKEETVKTISLFDEIILNTKSVKEGDIIE